MGNEDNSLSISGFAYFSGDIGLGDGVKKYQIIILYIVASVLWVIVSPFLLLKWILKPVGERIYEWISNQMAGHW